MSLVKGVVVNFRVVIPRELEHEKMYFDKDFPSDVRSKLVEDATGALAEYVKTKREMDTKGRLNDDFDLNKYTLDNGIEISWTVSVSPHEKQD